MIVSSPTEDAILKLKNLSADLTLRICQQIDRQGPLSFAEFMQLALYEPELGYYRNGLHKFGEAGDFITAPEISSLFSQCLARQCQQILATLADGCILEFGAGSGVMALDIMRSLQKNNKQMPQYYILEISAELAARQLALFQQRAPDLLPYVTWLDKLPEHFEGVILANEVIDAMPVHQFVMQAELREVLVTHDKQQLTEYLGAPKSQLLVDAVKQINIDFTSGYRSEINLNQTAWIHSVSECLQQGVVLLIDYGFPQHEYYHPDRNSGTLMCHYQHTTQANPYVNIGLQDITAHVDFTSIAQASDEYGLDVLGFTHQAGFLTNCGLTNFTVSEDAVTQFDLAQQIKKLTLPSEMGELFKVIALGQSFEDDLLGFSHFDQLHRL